METHADDPIDQPEADSWPDTDPWDTMAQQFSSLGHKLRDTYRQSIGDDGPDQIEVKAALRTLGNAWEKLTKAIGTAARDEQVRDNMKSAATGFFEAVGAAFSELGSELRRSGASDETVEEPSTGGGIVDDDGETATVGEVDDDPATTRDDDS